MHPLLTTAATACLLVLTILGAAAAGVWWAGLRPVSVHKGALPGGGSYADVRSAAGFSLRRWEVQTGERIPVALQFERHQHFGGGTIFLVSTSREGRLCAYAAGNLHRPAWSTGCAPPEVEMPQRDWFKAPQNFQCVRAESIDVFPESPGNEIVTVFHHVTWAPCMVRILDARGSVLFEAWHNGWITGTAWLSGPKILVLSGVNSEVKWFGRGVSGATRPYPAVVFAIRPQLGRRAGWISTPDVPGDLDHEWYKCVLPANALDADVLFPQPDGELAVAARAPDAFALQAHYVSLTFDATANLRRVFKDDKYDLTGTMPDPRTLIYLGNLPPIDPALAERARPAND